MNEDVLKLIVKLATLMCACDGEIHEDEQSLLSEWMETKSPRNAQLLTTLRKTHADTISELSGKGVKLKPLCLQLDQTAETSIKYDAMELCLRIAQTDGTGADAEMRFLMSIGKWMDIDYSKFREMRDKILPISLHKSVDVDALLGLHADMANSEKLKHLTKEFARWNQLATHSDSKKRGQAKEMLEIIARKRSELSERR